MIGNYGVALYSLRYSVGIRAIVGHINGGNFCVTLATLDDYIGRGPRGFFFLIKYATPVLIKVGGVITCV